MANDLNSNNATDYALQYDVDATSGPVATDASSGPYFDQTEIGSRVAVLIEDIVGQADKWNEGKGAFHQWNLLKAEAFPIAYELYLRLAAEGPGAIDVFLQRPVFKSWKRLPRSKPALLAMYIVLKPSAEDERKLCSSYTRFLMYAEAQHVAPKQYVEHMRHLSLADCSKQKRVPKPSNAELVNLAINAPEEGQEAGHNDCGVVTLYTPEVRSILKKPGWYYARYLVDTTVDGTLVDKVMSVSPIPMQVGPSRHKTIAVETRKRRKFRSV